MGKIKDFRMFMAEEFVKDGKGLIDLDKAFVIVDELWANAASGDKKSAIKLGKFAKMYREM